MTKLFFIKEKQTVVRVYDLNQEKTAEFQRIKGTWFLIGKFKNKSFTVDEFYRFLFHSQGFAPKNQKYSIAMDRSRALPLVKEGYTLLDENLNVYRYIEKQFFKNKEELNDLPLGPKYILEPFQEKIKVNEPVVTENAPYARTKEYIQKVEPNRPLQDSPELKIARFKIEKEAADKKVEKLQIQLSTETKKKVRYSIFSSVAGFASGFMCRHFMKKMLSDDLYYLLES